MKKEFFKCESVRYWLGNHKSRLTCSTFEIKIGLLSCCLCTFSEQAFQTRLLSRVVQPLLLILFLGLFLARTQRTEQIFATCRIQFHPVLIAAQPRDRRALLPRHVTRCQLRLCTRTRHPPTATLPVCARHISGARPPQLQLQGGIQRGLKASLRHEPTAV